MKSKLLLLAAVAAAAAACTPPTDTRIDPPNPDTTCDASEECPTGTVCSQGACVLGSCDPLLEQQCDVDGLESPFCCKPWELCGSVSLQCENDPNVHGIGCDPNDPNCTPCETQDDCKGGQFCSGASCFDAAGRDACTSSFQCRDGERCDRNVFLCVPDRGGCTFCGPEFPELCCEDGQVCSEESGFCQDLGEAECTSDDECLSGTFCDEPLQRCVECLADGDCGPNLLCDEGTGTCFSPSSRCPNGTDEECNGNQRCAVATLECVLAECETDADCRDEDARQICDTSLFRCQLPDAVCDETDEPNNDPNTATGLTDGTSYGGLLCRGDSDVLSFPVRASKRYTVTVDFGGSGQAGILVTLLNTTLAVESTASFTANQAAIQVAGVTGPDEEGDFYVKVQGNNRDRDQWTYSVTVREDEPSQPADCTPAGQPEEPNDTFDTATPLTLGQLKTFSRCGTNDVDFYKVTLPELNGITATMSSFFNAEGNMNIELFKAPNASSRVDVGQGVNDVEIVDGPEGPADYWLKVTLGSTAGAVQDQTYSLNTAAVPRPAACLPDATENDGAIDLAAPVSLVNDANGNPGVTMTDLVRCNPQDVDMFRFSMPTNRNGVVRLRFVHSEGDIKLELLRADTGEVVDSSNVSNANTDIDEQVEIPGSADQVIDYVAKVSLATATGGITGQRYQLEIATFDNSQCIASEPSGGDDTFQRGRCIGDFASTVACVNAATPIDEPMLEATLEECATAPDGTVSGCGRICGNDDNDWYRVGTLNNEQVLHAILDYNELDGELALVRGTLNANGTVSETTTTDGDHDGHVEFSFVAPKNSPKEYGVRVKPQGSTGHQVQVYSLQVEVGDQCVDDVNDAGALVNEKPADATPIRPNPDVDLDFTSSGFSRCNNDVDVYKLIAKGGETVTVSLTQTDTSPGPLTVELGAEPADLDDPAEQVTNGSTVAGGSAIEFVVPTTQVLYVTVKAQTGTVVTGPYTLHVTAN